MQPSTPNGYWYVANYTTEAGESPERIRQPTRARACPANDDMGPNDDTQVAVGPPPDSLAQFAYVATPVDVFRMKLRANSLPSWLCYVIVQSTANRSA